MTELVTQEDINKLVDLYFKQPDIMYSHLFSSYHQLIEEIIPYILSQENYFYESVDKDYVYLHGFKCNNVRLRPCTFENNSKLLFPNQARKNFLSYFGTIIADVQQYVVKENILSGEKTTKLIDNVETDTVIAKVPVMVKSKFCSTVIKKDLHGECKYDPGGIFLVNGQEKVIVSIEKMVDNKILVFSRRDSSYPTGKYFYAHINSRKNDWSDNLQILNIKQKKDGVFTLISSQFTDIPIFILFKAMGLETDRDIIANITYDLNDIKLLNLLRPSLSLSTDEDNNIIRTKEEAIEYLITKLKRNKRISQSDEDLAKLQKKVLLEKIIRVDLLPHMGNDIPGKIRFLGLMMNKLLNVILGRRDFDDRDSIMNKRVETPGILIGQLFKQNWKKLLNEVGKMFRKKNQNDMLPINVVGSLRSNTIEQGIKTALATGMWGMNRTKKGVAQSLQRLSWVQAIAYLRRVMTPSMNDATSGVISIRHLNNIAMYFLCPTETPEGQKIGLVKSLAMTATLTLQNDSQILIVKDIISKFGNYHHPADVDPLTINEWSKIFINGNWFGVTKKLLDIFTLLKEARRNGTIEKTVSLCLDCMNKEIHVYTDGGRLIRPLLNLKDNKLTLTKKIVKEIDELANSHDSVKGWKTLLAKYTDLVDYEDVESTNYLMIASGLDALEKNNDNMSKKIVHKSDNKDTLDRYGAYRYVNYSHCEFHPWLMLGTVTSTIPFANHNYGTKNIVNFSQVKQAIGIYLTSYKDRMDISQILYHPQLPIVRTKGTKYNHLDDLPTGENAIVAIMSYNGYNQEDSLIFNQTALDRGLFRADTLKKYHSQIEKNPSTSQDDEFRKPDRNKVTGIKQANYEKLNDEGFVPEETEIESGDIIIGKVSPIQPTGNDNKIYKDNSELYKHNVNGVIDRVHTGVYNADGYEMYNVRVRQERKPIIGDKFCLKADSEILTDSGWKKIKFIDIKNDKVATIDENKNLYYVNPSEKFEFDYDDDMFYYENKHVLIDCTMNHKLYVKMRGKKKYELIKAKDLNKRKCQVLKNCINNVESNDFITLNDKKFKTIPFLKLVGSYISDGNVNNNKVIISCLKERKIQFCRKYLNELNIDYEYKDEKIQFINKDLANYLKNMGTNAYSKNLNKELLKLSKEESEELLNSLLQGDGHTDKTGFSRYSTISEELANDISILAFNSGYSSHIKKEINKNKTRKGKRNLGSRKGEEISVTQKHDIYRISIIRKHNQAWMFKKDNPSNIYKTYHFKGKVYSIEVPESHIYYMRNDILSPPLWIGNSNRHG